jgi:hypothetical protein
MQSVGMEKELLRHSETWKLSYRDTTIEIIRLNFDTQSRMPWKENWNAYVYIYENKCLDFDSLWLGDELKRFFPEGAEYVSHEYMNSIFDQIEMHGGITYYAKHGHVRGHRCVQIGCDYQHYCDEGKSYSMEEILAEVKYSADQCVKSFYKKEEKI